MLVLPGCSWYLGVRMGVRVLGLPGMHGRMLVLPGRTRVLGCLGWLGCLRRAPEGQLPCLGLGLRFGFGVRVRVRGWG